MQSFSVFSFQRWHHFSQTNNKITERAQCYCVKAKIRSLLLRLFLYYYNFFYHLQLCILIWLLSWADNVCKYVCKSWTTVKENTGFCRRVWRWSSIYWIRFIYFFLRGETFLIFTTWSKSTFIKVSRLCCVYIRNSVRDLLTYFLSHIS